MISLLIILGLLGLLFIVICLGAVVFIDPIICLLIIAGLVKLFKWIFKKKG